MNEARPVLESYHFSSISTITNTMLLFAHIGITLFLFYMAALAFPKIRPHINYWYVIAGSMLPDIIDKTVGMILFADTFANGRIFAHALLFVVVLGAAGYYFYTRKGDSRVLTLAGASLIHQLLDSMWKTPVTFLWPLLGWEFKRLEGEGGSFWQYFVGIYRNLGSANEHGLQALLVTEVLGIAVVVLFLLVYIVKKKR
ncbi:hypothetical protein Mpsy_0526 [Methanolobus psychrophilus R15]|nr:hypothetical protein Mpsy_0526 [Methanolobus psychrophilus R15]